MSRAAAPVKLRWIVLGEADPRMLSPRSAQVASTSMVTGLLIWPAQMLAAYWKAASASAGNPV